jgi:hypothetical protein
LQGIFLNFSLKDFDTENGNKEKKKEDDIKEVHIKKGIKQPVPIRKNSLNNWDPSKG